MRRQLRQTKIGRLALLDLPGLSQYKNTIILSPYGRHDPSVFHGDGQGRSHIFKCTNSFTWSCIGRHGRLDFQRDMTGLFSMAACRIRTRGHKPQWGSTAYKTCHQRVCMNNKTSHKALYIHHLIVPQLCLPGLIWHRSDRSYLRTTASCTRDYDRLTYGYRDHDIHTHVEYQILA